MRGLILLLWLVPCVGCVKLPAPVVEPPASYLYGEGFSSDSLPYEIRWWERFGDSLLNRLELEALRQNRSLAEAASEVEAARLNRRSVRATYLPQLSLEGVASGNYTSGVGIEQEYRLAPSASWELPLFGALRAVREESEAEICGQEWTFRGVVLSLTAEVAVTYFTLLGYLRDWEIADHTCQLRYEALALTDSLLRYGMTTAVDRDQARSLLYTAASDRIQYERLARQTLLSLQALLGQEPTLMAPSMRGERLARLSSPEPIPVGLPSDLLHRRPDVMESLYALDAAAARVGLARAARYPAFSLTAEGGVVAELVKGVREGRPWLWSATASITAPLFAFGRLKAEEKIARENYLQSLFSYEETLLEALSDVEQALIGVASYREQEVELERLVAVNELILEKNRALYRNGMSPYLDVIDAERTYYQSQMELVDMQVNRLTAYVNLIKALGGGW